MALFDLIGQRWTLRIIWKLHHRASTFRELQHRCGGMSSSVLSRRLYALREVRLATVDTTGYRLTEQGEGLVKHLVPLVNFLELWAETLSDQDAR